VIRFHARLTVVGGLDRPARAEFADLVVHALDGDVDDLWGARWVDSTGDVFVGERDGARWDWASADGEPAFAPLDLLSVDLAALRRLMVVTAADLSRPASHEPARANPELDAARAALAAADDELAAALALGAKADGLRTEIVEIDEQVRAVEADESRRRYAALASELRRARAELAALDPGAMEDDARRIAVVDDVRARSGEWKLARGALDAERSRWDSRERLDPRTLAEALEAPPQAPAELDALCQRYEDAEAARARLLARLDNVATGGLAAPSHPAIVQLARFPQDELWGTAHRAMAAAQHLEDQSLALGGLQAEGVSPAAAAELEAAHDAVDLAVREYERRRFPGLGGAFAGLIITRVALITFPELIAVGLLVVGATAAWAVVVPKRELQRRQHEEAEALERAGVKSYITFQVRRLEVNIDPRATEPLELAALEYRRALAAWRKLAGDLTPVDGLALEAETRAYGDAIAGSRGAADELAKLRQELENVTEPALARARADLLAACKPFGVEDPKMAAALVRHQAEVGGVARLQAALERAERAERLRRADLVGALEDLGFAPRDAADDHDVDQRIAAYEQAHEQAVAREALRRRARPLAIVEADCAQLEARVAAERRPEWDDDPAGPPLDLDVGALRARRSEAASQYEALYATLPDIARVADRREALARRVEVLTNGALEEAQLDLADAQQVLLGRLASARRVGPSGESVPVVFDEPFERIHGDHKWALLDSLEKLSASVQLVYLTDDVDALVWARGRASRGTLTLLEPARDADVA
jgi:hypothetical protein